jgi:hypothetical protein
LRLNRFIRRLVADRHQLVALLEHPPSLCHVSPVSTGAQTDAEGDRYEEGADRQIEGSSHATPDVQSPCRFRARRSP